MDLRNLFSILSIPQDSIPSKFRCLKEEDMESFEKQGIRKNENYQKDEATGDPAWFHKEWFHKGWFHKGWRYKETKETKDPDKSAALRLVQSHLFLLLPLLLPSLSPPLLGLPRPLKNSFFLPFIIAISWWLFEEPNFCQKDSIVTNS